jgi:hypothetical protein
MTSGIGLLLLVKKPLRGIYIKATKKVNNIVVSKGVYLILEEFTENVSNNTFIEIMYDRKIVLIRNITASDSEILYAS